VDLTVELTVHLSVDLSVVLQVLEVLWNDVTKMNALPGALLLSLSFAAHLVPPLTRD